MRLALILIGKTTEEKLHILYRIVELLRLQHNVQGERFRNGEITQQQWDSYVQSHHDRYQKVMFVINTIKENNGYLGGDEKTEMNRLVKFAGKIASQYDGEIDIDNIQD